MDIQPIIKNRVFQAVAIGAVAVGVLAIGVGTVIGTAIKAGLVVGAGYLAYKYVVEPMFSKKRVGGVTKDQIREHSNHFYDKEAIHKEIKAKTFKR